MIKFKSQKVKRKREWKHLLENKNGKIWIVCGIPNESILLNKRNEFYNIWMHRWSWGKSTSPRKIFREKQMMIFLWDWQTTPLKETSSFKFQRGLYHCPHENC